MNAVESTADLYWTTLCNGLEQRMIENQSLANSIALQKINDFRRNVGVLLVLRAAIQSSPRRAIEGERSVSTILGISKSAVHTHLKRLGLKADMLREPSMTLEDLMQSSVLIQESLVEIQDWYKSWWSLGDSLRLRSGQTSHPVQYQLKRVSCSSVVEL